MRTSRASGHLLWSLPGRERTQRGTMTAESTLTESAKATMMTGNELAAVAGASRWEISDQNREKTRPTRPLSR